MNYALNEEKMFADVTDGIAIIINSETGIYYGLNSLGTSVYENLVNGSSTDEILVGLKTIAGCPSDIDEKLNAFIKSMQDYELIVEAPANSAEAKIDEAIAKEANFEFEVKAYDDAQELLLADPIHEVKEETKEREGKLE